MPRLATPSAASPSLAPVALHPLYYLHNFLYAMGWVQERYRDVLRPMEQAFLTEFVHLPETSQALLVRLLMRKGAWFRKDKLRYVEIGDIGAAAQPLFHRQWLRSDLQMSLAQWCHLHTKAELLCHGAHLGLKASMRKADMQAHLEALDWKPCLNAEAVAQDANYWCVTIDALIERLRLMFFGNLYQEWSTFVLADLGVHRYEVVPMPITSRAFQSCGDVDTYLQLHQLRAALGEADTKPQLILAELTQAPLPNPWLERRRHKLLMQLGQYCEKHQLWEVAEQAYTATDYHGACIRRIRVLEQLQRFGDALQLAQQLHPIPHSEEDAQKLERMLPRLQRALGLRVTRRKALTPEIAQLRTDISLPVPADRTSVEWALRAHWHCDAAPVYYVENTLINALFGLLFWPAIFAPVPGAFFHPFQREPADFTAPDFVQRRSQLLSQCWAQLENGSYQYVIRQRYTEKHGIQSPYVAWPALTAALLETALLCIPAAHLKLFFTRMLQDVKGHRTGFPDLVRFWPAQQRYQLVEVKGPGDKLQDNQIRWLQYCVAHGLPVQVCHVSWARAPSAIDEDLACFPA